VRKAAVFELNFEQTQIHAFSGRVRATLEGESPCRQSDVGSAGFIWWKCSGCSRAIFNQRGSRFTVKHVAFIIAVEPAPPELSQIAFADRLRAFYAERSRVGRPAIHQHEPHVAPPSAKQYTVSVGL
jgi:hypothetical protein